MALGNLAFEYFEYPYLLCGRIILLELLISETILLMNLNNKSIFVGHPERMRG